jgi:hypothetical protein
MGELADAFDAAMADLFDLVAPPGSTRTQVTAVDEDGTETTVRAIFWSTTASADQEGLEIDAAGMRNQETITALFFKGDLDAAGLTIGPTLHFLIDGERWDLNEDEMIQDKMVPLDGCHNLVQVILRKAVELNKSVAGSEFTYGP